MKHPATDRLTFGRNRRLRTAAEFAAVYRARVIRNAGPLRLYGRPNGLAGHRLGLSVSRRVGSAVVRNRIKRMLREAFRLTRTQLPGAYDLVLVVHPHPPLPLSTYQHHLSTAVARLHAYWSGPGAPPGGGSDRRRDDRGLQKQ